MFFRKSIKLLERIKTEENFIVNKTWWHPITPYSLYTEETGYKNASERWMNQENKNVYIEKSDSLNEDYVTKNTFKSLVTRFERSFINIEKIAKAWNSSSLKDKKRVFKILNLYNFPDEKLLFEYFIKYYRFGNPSRYVNYMEFLLYISDMKNRMDVYLEDKDKFCLTENAFMEKFKNDCGFGTFYSLVFPSLREIYPFAFNNDLSDIINYYWLSMDGKKMKVFENSDSGI